ncbi:MAG: hypothetical protein HYZ27_04375, partial [Deltaproteobacteria bacterium]|nr:hypothetical protein [Deltaproteobacteria bacterium]
MTSTDSTEPSGAYRWFGAGDLNAFFALMLDNMLNLVVLSGILAGAFGFPRDVILYKMIPGTALGVLIGDVVYSWLAVRLARKSGRQDITAMPLGLDTPSTIGVALSVLGPSFIAIKSDLLASGVLETDAIRVAAERTWAIGMAAMLMMGVVKVVFSFVGEWVRRRVPQAGLLGSIGGIGLALLCFLPLVDMFRAPVIGLVCLGLVLYTLVARIKLPFNLPGAAVGVLAGTALYYILGPLDLLGGETFALPTVELTPAFPWPSA